VLKHANFARQKNAETAECEDIRTSVLHNVTRNIFKVSNASLEFPRVSKECNQIYENNGYLRSIQANLRSE
jgi:hypothetical protein